VLCDHLRNFGDYYEKNKCQQKKKNQIGAVRVEHKKTRQDNESTRKEHKLFSMVRFIKPNPGCTVIVPLVKINILLYRSITVHSSRLYGVGPLNNN
jgi:hypothetical protein